MDDRAFQQWSETLAAMRQARRNLIDKKIQEQTGFDPKEYFDLMMRSMEEIVIQWWNLEKQSWETQPPPDPDFAVQNARSELDAVIDFELEAMKKEQEETRLRVSWPEAEVSQGESELTLYADELKKNYSIKADSLLNIAKKKKLTHAVPSGGAVRAEASGSSGGSGFWLLTMFLLGVALGAAPAVYFWDVSKKVESRYQQENARLLGEKRAFEASVSILQENFYRMAKGEQKTLPQLEAEIRPIRASYARRKKQAEEDYLKKKEALLRKEPPGDKLDRALEALSNAHASTAASLERAEQAALEPLLKQVELIKDLMGR